MSASVPATCDMRLRSLSVESVCASSSASNRGAYARRTPAAIAARCFSLFFSSEYAGGGGGTRLIDEAQMPQKRNKRSVSYALYAECRLQEAMRELWRRLSGGDIFKQLADVLVASQIRK